MTFHHLEQRLRELSGDVTFLRSAEHMQNWRRQIPAAVESGCWAACTAADQAIPDRVGADLGAVAAELLTDEAPDPPRLASSISKARSATPH